LATNDGLGLNDCQGVAPAKPTARQDVPENSIGHSKRWLEPFPFQNSYLLAKGKDFFVERHAAGGDLDDLMHAGKGIRWDLKFQGFCRRSNK